MYCIIHQCCLPQQRVTLCGMSITQVPLTGEPYTAWHQFALSTLQIACKNPSNGMSASWIPSYSVSNSSNLKLKDDFKDQQKKWNEQTNEIEAAMIFKEIYHQTLCKSHTINNLIYIYRAHCAHWWKNISNQNKAHCTFTTGKNDLFIFDEPRNWTFHFVVSTKTFSSLQFSERE